MSNHIASSSEDQTEPGGGEAENSPRGAWMTILAKADPGELDRAWETLEDKPKWRWLRKPETGLVMVRGRAGGTGAAFNLGEMTVIRCAVVTESADGSQGFTGQGYLAGRDRRHAELAALFDALLQDSLRRPALEDTLLKSLGDQLKAKRRAASAKSAATKVDFFTLVRGED